MAQYLDKTGLTTLWAKIKNTFALKSHPHSKSEVGLGNVDNTSDADKPVSNATQQALNLKANANDVYTKSETDNKINEPLYNLGYYDTITANSDGTYTITRQTGYYIFSGTETWGFYGDSFWYTSIVGLVDSNPLLCSNGIDANCNTKDQIRVYLFSNPSITSSTDMNSVFANGVALQYKLATSYTEKVEKNHYSRYNKTFILEHNKSEAERSANLFNNPYNYSGTNNGVSINLVGNECILNGTSTNGYYNNLGSVTLKAGTYTFNQVILSGSINGDINRIKFGLYKDGSLFPLGYATGTYTLTQDTTISIVVWFGAAGITFNNCKLAYMLNEGTTPLPYQPYEGKVVHEKELGDKLNSYVDISTRQEINALKRFNNGVALKRDDTGIFQTDDGANLAIKSFGRDLHFYGKSGVENYVANAILSFPYSGENNSYVYNFPQKTGTIALTSDFKTINGNSIVGSGDMAITADSVFTEVTDVIDTFTINRNGTWLITCLGYNKIYASDNSSIFFYGSALVSMTSAGSNPHICINGTAYACSSAITFITSGIMQVYKKAN